MHTSRSICHLMKNIVVMFIGCLKSRADLCKLCTNSTVCVPGTTGDPDQRTVCLASSDILESAFQMRYHDLIDGKKLSMLEQLLAQQLTCYILTDVKTHFKSHLAYFLLQKSESSVFAVGGKCSDKAHSIVRWDDVPPVIVSAINSVLPQDVKKNVALQPIVRDPSKFQD